MDRFEAMRIFTKVVESKSFTRAADMLDIPRASVSVTIQQLEALLKVRLLQRTTRRVSLTPDGATYYENCMRVLADIEDIESSLSGTGKAPQGKLRVDMPGALGRMVVMPKIREFHTRYPGIELMVGFGVQACRSDTRRSGLRHPHRLPARFRPRRPPCGHAPVGDCRQSRVSGTSRGAQHHRGPGAPHRGKLLLG